MKKLILKFSFEFSQNFSCVQKVGFHNLVTFIKENKDDGSGLWRLSDWLGTWTRDLDMLGLRPQALNVYNSKFLTAVVYVYGSPQ